MVQWGLLSANEIRDLEGRNAREGGDVFLTPLNMAPNTGAAPAPKKSPDDDDNDADEGTTS